MADEQLELFSTPVSTPAERSPERSRTPQELDDEALLDALSDPRPETSIKQLVGLIREAGQRRLAGAEPALGRICRRLTGFNARSQVPEQAAALRALADIGGRSAAQLVTQLIARETFRGPILEAALAAAAELGSRVPDKPLGLLLRNDDPGIRKAACRCIDAAHARHPALTELLDDLDGEIRLAAACALARTGSRSVRKYLLEMLDQAPSEEVIDALSCIADEDVAVLIGRTAEAHPSLDAAAKRALQDIDTPLASRIARRLAER